MVDCYRKLSHLAERVSHGAAGEHESVAVLGSQLILRTIRAYNTDVPTGSLPETFQPPLAYIASLFDEKVQIRCDSGIVRYLPNDHSSP